MPTASGRLTGAELRLEEQRLELERQRLELERQRLELERAKRRAKRPQVAHTASGERRAAASPKRKRGLDLLEARPPSGEAAGLLSSGSGERRARAASEERIEAVPAPAGRQGVPRPNALTAGAAGVLILSALLWLASSGGEPAAVGATGPGPEVTAPHTAAPGATRASSGLTREAPDAAEDATQSPAESAGSPREPEPSAATADATRQPGAAREAAGAASTTAKRAAAAAEDAVRALVARAKHVAQRAPALELSADVLSASAELDALARDPQADVRVQAAITEAHRAVRAARGRLTRSATERAEAAARAGRPQETLSAIQEVSQLADGLGLPAALRLLRERCEAKLNEERRARQAEAAQAAAAQEAAIEDAEQARARAVADHTALLARRERELRERAQDWLKRRDPKKLGCRTCDGSARVSCVTCDGTRMMRCDPCGGRGWLKVPNGRAAGRGYGQTTKVDCSVCPNYYSGQLACDRCEDGKQDCAVCVSRDKTPKYRALTLRRAFWDFVSPTARERFDREDFLTGLTRGDVLREQLGDSLGVRSARVERVELRATDALVHVHVVWDAPAVAVDDPAQARFEADRKQRGRYTTRWILERGRFYLATPSDVEPEPVATDSGLPPAPPEDEEEPAEDEPAGEAE